MNRAPVWLLSLFVFTASVLCAVGCLEEALDSLEHGGGGCTQCISTDFWASTKAFDARTLHHAVPANLAPALNDMPVLAITPHEDSRILATQSFHPPAITALRI
jgi:hypothetical protein